VNHGLLLGTLTRKFRGLDGFLFDRSYTITQCVRVGHYLSGTIFCHSRVPQGGHLGPLYFIADINDVSSAIVILSVLM
jgi:hypothetical protein